MRMDIRSQLTAYDIVNWYSYQDIERLIRQYGGEEYSVRIAKSIVNERSRQPILTTADLAKLVIEAKPSFASRIHPATQTFQALRIAVNDELRSLQKGLENSIRYLKPGGIGVVVSFHSLEDQMVKRFIRKYVDSGVFQKTISPGEDEIQKNPRSRSAKLRIFTNPQ